MAAGSALQGLLAPPVEGLGYELVHVELVSVDGGSTLRVYIDNESGITVEDCAAVSREVSALLDVEDPIPGEYRLEVSSPGTDRPLVTPAHFQQFAGYRARVKLLDGVDGRRKFTGRITSCTDAEVGVEVDGEEYFLPLNDIDQARLHPGSNAEKQGE